MEPINGRRLSRKDQRKRASLASKALLDGASVRRVTALFGYPSIHAMMLSVRRYRKRLGIQSGKGWIKLSCNTDGSVRLVLSARPLTRCRWKNGQAIHWHVEDGSIVLCAVPVLTKKTAFYTSDRPESVAYYLYRVQGMPLADVAAHLSVSRSKAYRLMLQHARAHPELASQRRSPKAAEGIVSVCRHGPKWALSLVNPVRRLGWDVCDIVRWECVGGHARILRLTREVSVSQAAG
ncbi:hypothetical protein HZA87_06105 [Candidatus Uhrbacteria bacterium]|nr:hypothetical protein [Candidatus Uhrbacteria bacterium]